MRVASVARPETGQNSPFPATPDVEVQRQTYCPGRDCPIFVVAVKSSTFSTAGLSMGYRSIQERRKCEVDEVLWQLIKQQIIVLSR